MSQYLVLCTQEWTPPVWFENDPNSISNTTSDLFIRVHIINVNNQRGFRLFKVQSCTVGFFYNIFTFLFNFHDYVGQAKDIHRNRSVWLMKGRNQRKEMWREERDAGVALLMRQSDLSKAIALQGCSCNQTLTLLEPQQSIDAVLCSR